MGTIIPVVRAVCSALGLAALLATSSACEGFKPAGGGGGPDAWSDGAPPDAPDDTRPRDDATSDRPAPLDGLAADGSPADGPAADGPAADGPAPDGPAPDGPRPDGPATDGQVLQPGGPCRPLVLPCLDPTDPKVIEVPTEATGSAAFAAAQAGDTIQIRGLKLGAGFWIPSYVTLRGCQGAELAGNIAFAGSGGIIEGFSVSGAGTVIAHRTGSYVVRYNRFAVDSPPSGPAGVSGRATDGLVSADVELLVESNSFTSRGRGVEAATAYDTGTHTVAITVRNNVFVGVDSPIVVSEGGLVGKITAQIEHNTLYGFKTGVTLLSLGSKPTLSGLLLASGDKGVSANSYYDVQHSLLWQVTSAHDMAPTAGSFASGDPAFVDASSGDLRLRLSSAAIDRLPAAAVVPGDDYHGCPRPVAALGGVAKADIGALETQPVPAP